MLALCIISLILSIISLGLSVFVGYLLIARFNSALKETKQLSDPDSLNSLFSGMLNNLNTNSSGGDDNETGKN